MGMVLPVEVGPQLDLEVVRALPQAFRFSKIVQNVFAVPRRAAAVVVLRAAVDRDLERVDPPGKQLLRHLGGQQVAVGRHVAVG